MVLGGYGSAVLAAAFPQLAIGFAGVALAFGLTVLVMAFVVGHISGGRFNPVVTIGLALTLIHLVSIPVTNASVNPARSTGVAIFLGGWALEQLWMFWLLPIIGAAIGGAIYRFVLENAE